MICHISLKETKLLTNDRAVQNLLRCMILTGFFVSGRTAWASGMSHEEIRAMGIFYLLLLLGSLICIIAFFGGLMLHISNRRETPSEGVRKWSVRFGIINAGLAVLIAAGFSFVIYTEVSDVQGIWVASLVETIILGVFSTSAFAVVSYLDIKLAKKELT